MLIDNYIVPQIMATLPVAAIRANIKAIYENILHEEGSNTKVSHTRIKQVYLEKFGPLFLGNKLDSTIRDFLNGTNSVALYKHHEPMIPFNVINDHFKNIYKQLLDKGTDVTNPAVLRITMKEIYLSGSIYRSHIYPRVSTDRLDRVLDLFIQSIAYKPAYERAPSTNAKELLLKHAKLITRHVPQDDANDNAENAFAELDTDEEENDIEYDSDSFDFEYE